MGRRPASQEKTYGQFEVRVTLRQGRTRQLPYTLWMPEINTAEATTLPRRTSRRLKAKAASIPGIEVQIPANVSLRMKNGKRLKQLSITRLPVDQTPVPVPTGTHLAFALQAHGAKVVREGANPRGEGVRILFPNAANLPVGKRVSLLTYDANGVGWFSFGEGTVSPTGTQIIPDPGVSLHQVFCFLATGPPGNAPGSGPPGGNSPDGGDPVNLATGLFVLNQTDLMLPDIIPLRLRRTYRQNDAHVRPFGIGASHAYEVFIVGDATCTYVEVVLPDGGRRRFERVSGTDCASARLEHTSTPSPFYQASLTYKHIHGVEGTWTLQFVDGAKWKFQAYAPPVPTVGPMLVEIHDRQGHRVLITRDSNGVITQVRAPNGRTISLTYDGSDRIISATDSGNRTVSYTYDGSGRLWKVTDPENGVTEYTYDASHRILTIKDARGIVFLTNEYDASGRVSRQIQADTSEFLFAYTEDPGGWVSQTDVTGTRGFVRRVTFNADGQALSDTAAVGRGSLKNKG